MAKTAVLWILLSVVFSLLWTVPSPGKPTTVETADTDAFGTFMPLLLIVLLAFFGWLFYENTVGRRAFSMLTAALSQSDEGNYEALAAKLDAFSAQYPSRNRTVVATTRALLALYAGDLPRARGLVDATLDGPQSIRQRLFEKVERPGAHAMRALLAATTGEREVVERDAAVVLSAKAMVAQVALARVALARAVIAERQGDRPLLRKVLGQERALLLNHAPGRERVLTRALMQLAAEGDPSAYRVAATEEPDEPELARWVGLLAPAAAPFVRRQAPAADAVVTLPPTSTRARQAVAELHTTVLKAQPNWGMRARIVGLWIGLVMVFMGFWAALTPGPDGKPSGAWLVLIVPLVLLGGIVWWLLHSWRKQQRAVQGLHDARRQLAVGKLDEALSLAQAALEHRNTLVKSQAHLLIAEVSFLRATLDEALHTLQLAIGYLGSARQAGQPQVLIDSWRAQARRLRATVLAAAGRIDEACAEIEQLGEEAGAVRFRVALFDHVHRGALKAAQRQARGRSVDIATSAHDELICSLLDLHQAPDPRRVEALREELAHDEVLAHWASAVVPALMVPLRA